MGCIIPSGVATDDTTKFFFQRLVETGSLVSLLSFENEDLVFPGIHHATRFCLLTLSAARQRRTGAEFAFYVRQADDVTDPNRRYTLTLDDFRLLNPNTLTCPTFRTRHDAELAKIMYQRFPVLENEKDWLQSVADYHFANVPHG